MEITLISSLLITSFEFAKSEGCNAIIKFLIILKEFRNNVRVWILLYVIFYLNCSNTGSGVYQISTGNNQHVNVYCHMTSISGCSGGGWTLVMKIDGSSVRLREDTMISCTASVCKY